jgi:hypothetical protein
MPFVLLDQMLAFDHAPFPKYRMNAGPLVPFENTRWTESTLPAASLATTAMSRDPFTAPSGKHPNIT